MKDFLRFRNNYKGLATPWPKYMKHLRSLDYQVEVESSAQAAFESLKGTGPDVSKLPSEIKLMTDDLRYLTRLERIKVSCPPFGYCGYLDKIWKFEKYPISIKKLSFHNVNCGKNSLDMSLAHLKSLKVLEMRLHCWSSVELYQKMIDLLSEVPQLEALTIDFDKKFEIDESACKVIKSLTKLKKIKLELFSGENGKNLQIFKSLEECPSLKSLNLKLYFEADKEIGLISSFLKNKTDLEVLKLQLLSAEKFKGSSHMNELAKTIDDLPLLTSLSLVAESQLPYANKLSSFPRPDDFVPILAEKDILFPKILSKTPNLKKFRLSLAQHRISREGLLSLLSSLRRISLTLEKLQIDVGGCKLEDNAEKEAVMGFISSLKRINSLEIGSLEVVSRQFWHDLRKAVLRLKFLKTLKIGKISGDITKQSFVNGVEKILFKCGLEEFLCETPLEFGYSFYGSAPLIKIDPIEIRKKNPFLKKKPDYQIYSDDFLGSW